MAWLNMPPGVLPQFTKAHGPEPGTKTSPWISCPIIAMVKAKANK
jgi:hypothetical protein